MSIFQSADGLTEFVALLGEQSYHETAEKITEMTGQSISAMGVWNAIQVLAEHQK